MMVVASMPHLCPKELFHAGWPSSECILDNLASNTAPATASTRRRAAAVLTLSRSISCDDIDPQAWPADVLARINDHAIHRLDELLSWNWRNPVPSHLEAA
jgi:hypothetical protein